MVWRQPLGEKKLRCIESWKRNLPNYEIVRWHESNFDVRCCDYVSEAYDASKWDFVSDYARLLVHSNWWRRCYMASFNLTASLLLLATRNKDSRHRFPSICDTAYVGLSVTALRISIIERVALYMQPFVCLSYERVIDSFSTKSRYLAAVVINALLFSLYSSYAVSSSRIYSFCF